MEILDPGLDLESFFAALARSQERALLLDYDGTLAPFHVDPQLALPFPGVLETLVAIQERGDRVALITGRAVSSLLPLLGGGPRFEIWGSYGGEHLLPGGSLRRRELDEPATAALAAARAAAGRLVAEGARLEGKPLSLALHVRGLAADLADRLVAEARSAWGGIAGDAGLELRTFDGGLELQPAWLHKGGAVRAILEELHPDAAVALLGDDLSDEDGFRALHGRGLPVLVRGAPRPTAARVRLTPPEELRWFLSRWRRAWRAA